MTTKYGAGLVDAGIMYLNIPVAPIPPAPSVPPTKPPPTTYLFNDEFNGTTLDSTKWYNADNIQYGGMSYSKAANATLDGNGNLDLKITRENWNGKAYAGASVGTYLYQTGWPVPAQDIKASWKAPFSYETRFLLPDVLGAWISPGWNQNIDRPTSQVINEIDLGEIRSMNPTWFGANQHKWQNGAEVGVAENGGGNGSDGRTNWHVMRVDALADSTKYYLDGTLVATHSAVSGVFGAQLHAEIADVGQWAAGGTQPDPNSPGPWHFLIDYVRVTAL
jgi:hypothetical protein